MRAPLGKKCAFLLLAAATVSFFSVELRAQQPTLPGNWQSLGPADFGTAVTPFYDLDAETLFVKTIDDDAVRTQAAALIANIDFSNSQLGFPVLNTLQMLANPKLADADRTRISNGLTARQDDWTGHPFSDFYAKWNLIYRLKLPAQLRVQEGTRWAQAGGQLAAVPPQNLPEAYLYFAATSPQQVGNSFSVQWQGQLTPPQTGAYTFSISPINVNSSSGQNPVQVTTSVSIGGNVILAANANQWTRSSAPINLTAGQPVAISMSYTAQVGQPNSSRGLHTVLLWQGPRIASSTTVPSSVLTLPDGSAAGLQTTYSWTDSNGNQQTLSRTEPAIDAVWISPPNWLLADPGPASQAGTSFLQTVTSSNGISGFTNLTAPVQWHQLYPPFFDPDGTAQLLNSSQRGTLLSLIQSQPTLLDVVDPRRFAAFYGAYRLGNPDAALQLAGLWATRQADIVCAMPTGGSFDMDSRAAYRRLAVFVTQQMPEQAGQLQSQFLVTPDGRCCLPVAYTLALSYLGQNNLVQWAQYLNTQLQNSTLTGDLRVNWLLARAFVQEIRQSQPTGSLNSEVYYRPTDSSAFIAQAIQSAQSPAVKVRASLESAGRLMATGQFSAATSALQPLMNSVPADQQAILTTWLNQIAALQAAQANSAANQTAAAQQAYLTTLRQRRDQASAQGDTVSVNRYNAIINTLTSQ